MPKRAWKETYREPYFNCICCGEKVWLIYGFLNGEPLLFITCHGEQDGDECIEITKANLIIDDPEVVFPRKCHRCTRKVGNYVEEKERLFSDARTLFEHALNKYSYLYCSGFDFMGMIRYHLTIGSLIHLMLVVNGIADFKNRVTIQTPALESRIGVEFFADYLFLLMFNEETEALFDEKIKKWFS